jgi:hypothetical protein
MNANALLIKQKSVYESNREISLINTSNEKIFNLRIDLELNGNIINQKITGVNINSKEKVTFGIIWMEIGAKDYVSGHIQWNDKLDHNFSKDIVIVK